MKKIALGLASLAAMTTLTGIVAGPAYADLAADCAIIGPIASSAVGRLTPIQTLPDDQKQGARDAYIAELQGQRSGLTSAEASSHLQAYINALQNATGPGDAQTVLNAIITLQSDCG